MAASGRTKVVNVKFGVGASFIELYLWSKFGDHSSNNWRRGQTFVVFGKKIPASSFAVGFRQLSTAQGETLLFTLSLAHSRVPLCAVLLTSSYLASLVYVILLYCVCYNLPLWNSYLQQSALGSVRCLLNI